jgi:hypothetical protein
MKSHPVPTQQFKVLTRTEFGENLAFHSGECIFHIAEHINKKNRYNNSKLSWLRILAQYQKTVKFFWSDRTHKNLQACQATFRILFF